MTRKKRICVLFVAACIAVIGFIPGPAVGTVQQDKPRTPSAGRPADLSAEDDATMNRQIPLTRVATHIRNLVEDGVGRPGFAGFAGLETPGDTLLLWWKGPLPKQIQDAVRQAKIPIEVRAAAYSKKELKATSTKLMKSSGVKNGGPIHAVMMPFDGSGLEASVLPGRPRSLAAANQVGVPVTVVEREPMKTQYNRCNDSSPWYGGGAIFNTSVGGGSACGGNASRRYHCSTSFSVALGGAPYMLTAGHCGAPGNTFHNTGAGGRIGQAAHEHVPHDLMLISTDLAGGSMWDGSVNEENYSKRVVRWDWAHGEQELCHSGATTGSGCGGARVAGSYPQRCNYRDIHGPWECYDDLIAVAGGTRTAPGDSGGAWFTKADPNWTQVSAIGNHTGYQAAENQMVFQDIGTATRDWPGLAVITW